MRLAAMLALIACAPGFVAAAGAGLSGKDRQEAKEMVRGPLYLRVDVPCIRGRKGCSLFSAPLAEVSPTGYSVTGDAAARADPGRPKSKWFLIDAALFGTPYWGFGPNDAVERWRILWDADRVILLLRGLPARNRSVQVMFYNINTLDDFKAAFNRTFSKVPLVDEHPEWPAEIRKAIAERRVVEGMTKRQAFCVVGLPTKTQTSAENGAEVETWLPRQESGAPDSFGKPSRTGFPASLKFVNGKLAGIEMTKTQEPPE